MGEVKQIEIKNRTYYFYNNMINLKNIDPNLLKIDKKSYKNIGIYDSGECDYEIDLMKIKFNSDDDLPLNKPLKFHAVTMIIRSVFEEDGKLYSQVFSDDALYELSI